MDIVQLKYFMEVAKLQNITKASEKIHVAQPALSQSISKLEQELDVKLFDRIGKSIQLNANGKLLMRRSQEAILILENVKQELHDLNDSVNGTIYLQMMVGSGIFPKLIASFMEQWTDIHFQLVQQGAERERGLCITTPINGVLPETSHLLLEEEIMLAVPQSHSLAKNGSVSLSQMRNYPFLSLDPNKPLRKLTDIFCQAAGFTPDIVMQADNPSTLRGMIALGLGIAFAPAVSWPELRNISSIVLLHIERPICRRMLCITWQEDRYLTLAEHKFLDFASTYFTDLKRLQA